MITPLLATLYIALCLCGTAVAGYLSWTHQRGKKLVCPFDHDCSTVTESRWSRIFYFRNDTLGLLYYLGLLFGIVLALALPTYEPPIRTLLLWASGLGVAFSAFLVYVQFAILKDYCFYCLVSAGITASLLVTSLLF